MRDEFKKSIVLLYKLLVYVVLFLVFFEVFSVRNIGLQNLSRTVVIIMMTFIVFGIVFLNIYGNFGIGKEKTRPVIFSTSLAVIITDIITYLQLMVMNTNPQTGLVFKLKDLDLLLLVIIIHIVIISISSRLGNKIYFSMYEPRKTIIIYDEQSKSVRKITNAIKRYSLQYDLVGLYDKESSLDFLSNTKIDYCIIATYDLEFRDNLIAYCFDNLIDFSIVPSIEDVNIQSSEIATFDDIAVFDTSINKLTIEQRIFKRLIDILVSITMLVITLPITLLVSIAIKMEDGGKVFFKQNRLTKDRQEFEVIKFRSMKENVENYSVIDNDDRITKVGKFIRKTRIDELPQFLNVLRGSMSVVGPRPEMIENVEQYEKVYPQFAYRLRVKAGLTGLAQIEGKYNTSPKDKLILDLIYIRNFSIWNDLKLMFRTLTVLVKKDSTEAF